MSSVPTGAGSFTLAWLLNLLETQNLITAPQKRDIEVRAPSQRARLLKQKQSDLPSASQDSISPVELLASLQMPDIQDQILDDDRLTRIIADATHLPYRKIDPLQLDMGLVSRTLSRPFALRHVVLPLSDDGTALLVAVENPFDTDVVENLTRIVQRPINRVIASRRDILKCLTEIFGFRKSVESAAAESKDDSFFDFEQLVKLRTVGEIEASDQHIVNAVDFLLAYAFDQRASDIHIEPRREHAQVRLRIDGVLHDVHTIPRHVVPAFTSRIKMMARLDIAERRRPQDGRIKTILGDKSVEMRVSTLPVAFGEKSVLRIFDPGTLLQDVEHLGLDEVDRVVFERWLSQPHGLILITGPTGSGKTTTLYTALRSLADKTVNITTVEDPIEMVTDVFNQVAVQPKIGVDFPSALRTILRQDPDIIMIGEIRDGETAEMAVQAALTGHLVFSTLHTNDTVTAVTRLGELGLEKFLVSSTVLGVMAQRLLRRVCSHCAKPRPLSQQQIHTLKLGPQDLAHYSKTMAGVGCTRCRSTGYLGRTGIFEMLDFNNDIRLSVGNQSSAATLMEIARSHGLRTLRECALQRMAQGQTTFEEVIRVTGIIGS